MLNIKAQHAFSSESNYVALPFVYAVGKDNSLFPADAAGRDGASESEFQFLLIIRIASLQNCSAE